MIETLGVGTFFRPRYVYGSSSNPNAYAYVSFLRILNPNLFDSSHSSGVSKLFP